MRLGKGFKIFLYVLACLFIISTLVRLVDPYGYEGMRGLFWGVGGICLLVMGISIFNNSTGKGLSGAKAVFTIFLAIAIMATLADRGASRYDEPTMRDDYSEEYLPLDESYEDDPYYEDAPYYGDMDTSFDGGLVNGNVYSLSEIGELSGFFTLNPANQTVTGAAAPFSWWIYSANYHDGINKTDPEMDIAATYYAPVTVDRAAGEKLIIVGSMGDYVEDILEFAPARVIGYTNFGTMVDVSLDEVEMLMGVDISGINTDVAQVNSAISNTPFTVAHYSCQTANNDYIFDTASSFSGELYISDTYGAELSYGFFEGTDYYESSVAATDLTYLYDYDEAYTGAYNASVERTMDGYFVVDTSHLSAGHYVLYMYSDAFGGNNYYPFYIK